MAPGYIEYPLWVAPHERPLAGSKHGIKPWNRTSEMMHYGVGYFSYFLAHLLADVLAHLLADVLAHLLADVLAHLLADVLAHLLANVPAHFLADVLAHFLAHLLSLYLPA